MTYVSFFKNALPLAIALALPILTQAQKRDSSEIAMQQQFMKMQKQMLDNLRNNGFGDSDFGFLGDTSMFYFHSDTAFGGKNGMDLFNFSPFGEEPDGAAGMQDMSKMLQRFFDMAQGFEQSQNGENDENEYLEGDGTDDDLLPEERLRLEEEKKKNNAQNDGANPPEKPKTETKKPKRKVTRI